MNASLLTNFNSTVVNKWIVYNKKHKVNSLIINPCFHLLKRREQITKTEKNQKTQRQRVLREKLSLNWRQGNINNSHRKLQHYFESLSALF